MSGTLASLPAGRQVDAARDASGGSVPGVAVRPVTAE